MKKHKLKLYAGILLAVVVMTSFKPGGNENNPYVEINTRYGKMIFVLYNETPLHRDNFIKRAQQKGFDSLLFHRVIPELMIQGGDPKSKYAKPGVELGITETGTGIPMELSTGHYHKRGALAMARDRRNTYESSPNQFYIVQGRTFTADELLDIENSNNINGKRELLNNVMKSDTVMARIDDFKLRGDKDGLHTYMLSLQDGLDKIYEPHMFRFTPEQGRDYVKVGGAPHLDGQYTVFGELVYGWNVLDSIANAPHDAYDRPLSDIRMMVKVFNTKAPVKN